MFTKLLLSAFITSYILFKGVNGRLVINEESHRFPFDRQLLEDVLDPEQCSKQLSYLTENTGLLARFLDAGLRVPRGILDGNLVDLGNYHQCLGINVEAEDMAIRGKYCRIQVPINQEIQLPNIFDTSLIKLEPNKLQIDNNTLQELEAANRYDMARKSALAGLNMDVRIGSDSPLGNLSFQLAVCLPRPCTTEEMINGLLLNLTDLGFEYHDVGCRLPEDRPWVAADYVAIVIFSIIGFLTVISTCYDLYHCIYLKKGKKDISQLYTSFSVYTNTRRLVSFNSSPGSVDCLDGIRTLAIVWIILGHSFLTVSLPLNPIEAFQWSISLESAWITVAPLSVDTFFFLSGFLLVYSTVGKLGRMQLIKNLHVFYLHRLLRLFPILAAVILFEASIFMRVSDGPLWGNVGNEVFKCREFWWSTLLHLQNFVNPQHACIGTTWYLAIDVQLHILSPIILFWVLTSKRAAWISLNTGLVAILTASTVFLFFKNLPSGTISPNREDDLIDFFNLYYMNILTRASPFMVGMIYGYLIHVWRKNNVHIPKVVTLIFLLFSLLTMLAAMYCSQIAMRLDWDNQIADNFFNSFLRFFWAVALGWLVFACIEGSAGPINWFLSLNMWKLPARISYATYLVHYSMMIAYNASIVAPIHFTVPAILFQFMAQMFITLILSFFVTLLIDSPFSTLFKILLGGGVKKSSPMKLADSDPIKNTNVRGNYSLAADDIENKHQTPNVLPENSDLKLNINENGNSELLRGRDLKVAGT